MVTGNDTERLIHHPVMKDDVIRQSTAQTYDRYWRFNIKNGGSEIYYKQEIENKRV